MIRTKYFDGIRKAQQEQRPVPELPAFDLDRLRATGLTARITAFFLENPRWWLALLRRFRPNVGFGNFLLVTRNEDVRDILERGDEFATPYGAEMTELANGKNFILGMADGADYRRMKSAILSAFPPSEVEAVVRPIAARHSTAIMRLAEPGFDAVSGLLKVVPVRICRDYFGLEIDDESAFADWSIALSALFFSDPFASPVTRELAVVAGGRLTKLVDRSIQAIRERGGSPDTPLGRMVAQMDAGNVSQAEIHSVMMGMVSGFAPTNLLAAGNCLDVILSKPEAQEALRAALAEGDNGRLDRIILEAMRFKPIWIGPWRYVPSDAVIARGTNRERLVKAGTTVMPSTLSAMFDPDAVPEPGTFDPNRPQHDYLVYGRGIHLCIGAEVARVQIGESLRALFRKEGLRRAGGKAGRLTRIGAYPASLKVDFERSRLCRTTVQSMTTVVIPVKPEISLSAVREKIAALGNPVHDLVRDPLDASGVIHFASLAVIPVNDDADPQEKGAFVLELSGDGDAQEVLAAFAAATEKPLRPILAEACGLPAGMAVQDFLNRHRIDISQTFGSNAGLVFCGTPGHSVQRIRAEAELAAVAREFVERPRSAAIGAADVLAEVRRHIEAREGFGWALEPAESLLEKPRGNWWRAASRTLAAPPVTISVALLLLCCWWTTFSLVFDPVSGIARNLLIAGTALVLTLMGVSLLAILFVGVYLLALRRLEKSDRPDDSAVDLDLLDRILANENHAAQNNLIAVSTLKPGLLRRMALRLAFYVVSIASKEVFRPGFLININTIHFARWVVLPGTGKLVFFSNYGGSWESYLEDFIAKAASGLTGIWSNALGFPRTRWLALDGARDGDRFKRWARRQQIPTLFWYSAYPGLDTVDIRVNSAIRRGFATATEYEARDWLSLFGSLPRPATISTVEAVASVATPVVEPLDTGEIQSIFFSAFGALPFGHMLAIRIPDGISKAKRRQWLDFVTARTCFGDTIPRRRAAIVGIGCEGLARLGLNGGPEDDPLATFPSAFRHGMGDPQRSRILNDTGRNAPEHWRWGSPDKRVDMVILCYAAEAKDLDREIGEVKRAVRRTGMQLVTELPLVVKRVGKRAVEHFGFADGVSQPIVKGSARANGTVPPMHLVAPGEFLLGYRDESGFYPPCPVVPATLDRNGILPEQCHSSGDVRQKPAAHEFGRNGSFMVVRQMEQHVEDFEDYCSRAAQQAAAGTGNAAITPGWVAAKMLGRWPDGSSLVRNPEGRPGRLADNDFSFGREDPQGHRCPLGAHIRRSNPRDSLGEDRETQIRIGKRHRILRVGRTYETPGNRSSQQEKGLLFMCLNADIERQYEFIQQTWVSAGSFQGLAGENDPTIGSRGADGRFTIPSWDGPVVLKDMPQFVTTRGGGYFFMPSRSALRFLLSRL